MRTNINTKILIAIMMIISIKQYSQVTLGLATSYSVPLSQPVSRMYGSNEGYITYQLGYVTQNKSFDYGVAFKADFRKLVLLGELLYNTSKSQFLLNDYVNNEGQTMFITETTNNIKVPIAGIVNFNMFHIGAGPIFTYNLESDDMVKQYSDFKDKNIKIKPSFQFLVGTSWKQHLMLNLKYEYALSKIGDDYSYNYSRSKLDRSVNYFSISLNIFP